MKDKSVYKLNLEMQAARELIETLREHADDKELIADTIEGETGLVEAIASAVGSMLEDEVLIEGLKPVIAELSARLKRITDRHAMKRAAIEQAMTIAECESLELPTITASLKKLPRGLEIIDESAIPAAYWKAQDPKLDKRTLLSALKEGATIPGAQLDNGGIALQMRRK